MLVYQVVLRYISFNVVTFITFQLVLKYISVNLGTSIGLSISFKKY